MESVKRSVVSRSGNQQGPGGRGQVVNGETQRIYKAVKITLYGTVMGDTCHYVCVLSSSVVSDSLRPHGL